MYGFFGFIKIFNILELIVIFNILIGDMSWLYFSKY